MSEPIKPALTPEEWAVRRTRCGSVGLRSDNTVWVASEAEDCEDVPGLIALANAALPDGDPRKITREWVRVLLVARDAGRIGDGMAYAGRPLHFGEQVMLREIADALASYLPPEP